LGEVDGVALIDESSVVKQGDNWDFVAEQKIKINPTKN
jgi:hypothetical protein